MARLRSDGITSQGRSKVDEVMLDEMATIFRDKDIHIIARFSVKVFQPSDQNVKTTKLPAMLMRNDVVGIIVTCSQVFESSEILPIHILASQSTDATIRESLDFVEKSF